MLMRMSTQIAYTAASHWLHSFLPPGSRCLPDQGPARLLDPRRADARSLLERPLARVSIGENVLVGWRYK
jgi:hypothetical protein